MGGGINGYYLSIADDIIVVIARVKYGSRDGIYNFEKMANTTMNLTTKLNYIESMYITSLLYKSEVWRSEQEVRIIVIDRLNHKHDKYKRINPEVYQLREIPLEAFNVNGLNYNI